MHRDARTVGIIRTLLLATLVVGMVGTLTELLLLGHTEDTYQLIPIALLALALASVLWYGLAKSPRSLRAVQGLMIMFTASGIVGLVLHYTRNLADARESDPSLSGNALYLDAAFGSTPALAPGAMIQLGLIGLVFAFRHPVFSTETATPSPPPLSS